jgi:hypothetical protein
VHLREQTFFCTYILRKKAKAKGYTEKICAFKNYTSAFVAVKKNLTFNIQVFLTSI